MKLILIQPMIRTVLFWTHLVAGVVAGAIILVMSVTGVALTYEKQMLHWADLRQLKAVNAPVSTHLSADSLLALAAAAKPAATPASITFRSTASEPALVSFGRSGNLYLDPASGAVLGEGSATARAFFRSMTDWHRWLAGEGANRERGKAITGAANLAFLILVLSGMVLWLPKTLKWIQFRSVLWFRSGLSAKARDFNWHNVLGIWSAIPLIAIVASASVIGYPWASDLVYRVAGEAPPPRGPAGPPPGEGAGAAAGTRVTGGAGSAAGVGAGGGAGRRAGAGAGTTAPAVAEDARNRDSGAAPLTPAPRTQLAPMVATALTMMPGWKAVTVQVPKAGAKTASITLDRGTGGQPQLRSTVQVSTSTGAIAKYQPFDSLSAGRKARSVLRFAHTGEVLGLTGQTIAGLVTLASVILVYTGIALALRRAARALARRDKARVSEPAVGGATG